MIEALILFSFSFFFAGDEWRVFISDEIPCSIGCVVPFAKFMYLDYNCLNLVDPWGNSLFEHELKHILEPDWKHDLWETNDNCNVQ